MALHQSHYDDEAGNQEESDPSSFCELGNQYDDHREPGRNGAQSVHEHASRRARAPHALPMDHHTRLGEREGHEGAHGIKGNQAVRNPAEYDEQRAGQQGQRVDTLGIDQAAAADCQAMRQETVFRDGPRKARKIGEGRVRRQRQDQQNRPDAHAIEDAIAGNGRE